MFATEEEILFSLAEFIFEAESNSEIREVTSHPNNIISVARNGEVYRLIGFVKAEDCETRMHALREAAQHMPKVSEIVIFYTGTKRWTDQPQAIPNRTMLVAFSPVDFAWNRYPDLRYGRSDLGLFVCKEYSERLKTMLSNLPPGDGVAYENLLALIFSFAFPSCIRRVVSHSRTVGNQHIRDLLLRIRANSELQRYIRDSHRTANTIVVEAKNVQKNSGNAIQQLEGYLGHHRTADIGFLVTRKPLGRDLLPDAMRGRRERAPSALIVPISKKQIRLVLQNAAVSEFGENEGLLISWISDAIDKRP